MASTKIQYNLPGCGLLNANLYSYTQSLIDFLGSYGHMSRLERLDQLGKLREVFPGAHHTRYEYVFLQWALITEMAEQKDAHLGLSAKRKAFGTLPGIDRYPSSSELLQCLVLLMNVGYLDGTFAASRAWINILKTNKKVYNNFKSGLDKQDVALLDDIINSFDFYRFHIVLTLFMLQRYKRKSEEHVLFCSNLIRQYQYNNYTDSASIKTWELFKNVRRIAYLALDAFYAPVPFTLDVSSIMMSFRVLYNDMFVQAQTFQAALKELERVLQNTVYLSPGAVLKTSQATELIQEEILSHERLEDGILGIHACVSPNHVGRSNKPPQKNDWDENKVLMLTYDECDGYEPSDIYGQVIWEKSARARVGKTFCRFSLLHNPGKNMLRLCVGMNNITPAEEAKAILKIVNECVKFTESFKKGYKDKHYSRAVNADGIFKFLLKAVFGWNTRFILSRPIDGQTAFIGESGRIKYIKRIDSYISRVDGIIDKDSMFEVTEHRRLVEEIKYSGYMIGFMGSTRLFVSDENMESTQFDGILFKINASPYEPFVFILESKNKHKGKTEANAQLSKRLGQYLASHLEFVINELSEGSVYAAIKLKQ